MKLLILCLCSVVAIVAGQRITTIQLDGVQYFVSRMNPYSPELNYFLAYQYCRSLGLQLASFETQEKVESMSQYLQNAGYSKYDFWTSGNRLGTGMFLWMSTGLPFNATFDYFENSNDAVSSGQLDPIDHNSNTSPQRTARDRYSKFTNGLEKGCVMLQAPELRWAPEDCSEVKDFICEQTRCYYYNYGSIPVSSAQGRPIVVTTTPVPSAPTTVKHFVTTPLPLIMSEVVASTLAPRKSPPAVAPTTAPPVADAASSKTASNTNSQDDVPYGALKLLSDSTSTETHPIELAVAAAEEKAIAAEEDEAHDQHTTQQAEAAEKEASTAQPSEHNADEEVAMNPVDAHEEIASAPAEDDVAVEETTSVEQRLKKISEEIEKYSSSETDADMGRQSFFSLSDLIKTLRPSDKKVIPQIDSDYSNTMRVLGETSSIVSSAEDARKIKDGGVELKQANRALY